MRGHVAKQLRRILFALQVKNQVPRGSEYVMDRKTRVIRCIGARAIYQGMKRERKRLRALTGPPPVETPRWASDLRERDRARARRRAARARRRAAAACSA